MDYELIYFILFFLFWIYSLELAIEKRERIGYSYLQFGLMIPLCIFIGTNAYVNSFVFGYVFTFAIAMLSLYVLATKLYDER